MRESKRNGRPSSYRPEVVEQLGPGLRATARLHGVAPSTLKRWAEAHYLELGAPLYFAAEERRLHALLLKKGRPPSSTAAAQPEAGKRREVT